MDKTYVLEVIKYISDENWIEKGGRFQHIGYMQAIFKTKKDACSYYDRNNPHMRKLNTYNTYESDNDPKTQLFYIVRRNYGLIKTIPPFKKEDEPEIDKSSGLQFTYKYLK